MTRYAALVRRSSRPLASIAVLSLLSLTSSAALAEPLAPRLTRLLDAPGRRHPFADRSGRIPITIPLPAGVTAASLGLFGVAPGVGSARLSPTEITLFAAAHPGLGISMAPPRRPLLDVSDHWTRLAPFRAAVEPQSKGRGKGVAIGIIDTGIDVRHPDFLDENGKTRVAWLLTGGAPVGLHPELEERFGCTDPKQNACAIRAAADIDEMIASGAGPRDLEGHGTHVASIAAGNGGPTVVKHPRYVGVAPEATLIVAAPGDASSFYDDDIIKAAQFVFDRAEDLHLPVVANLSLGGDYGSHDGLSALETGLSALVGDDKPGRVMVVAAGNSGALLDAGDGAAPYGIHTEVHVAPHEITRVPIRAGAARDGQAFVWITFRPGDEVEVGLEGPKGASWVGFTGAGDESGYSEGSGADLIKAGVVNNLPKSNDSISAETNSAVVVFAGHWAEGELAVRMRGSGDASLWITGTGDANGALYFAKAIRQGTVNVPASAPALLAVGCTINRIAWQPFSGKAIELGELGGDPDPVPDGACFFSAAGPTPFGVQKPEISAPGGFVGAAMSADADPRAVPGGLFDLQGCPAGHGPCAVLDDHHALAAGTSMAAPHVSGAIALLMELDPTLTQARATEVLQAGARRPTGHVPDPVQLGTGTLDLEGARQALLDASAVPADPDLSKSWYTLSSAYARADVTWPVWGTVQLRKLDGSLAGGVDGSRLALAVSGGAVVQPLVKVRQGMWRFAVAGRSGDIGGTITVDVTYDGVSLGESTLPVGTDVWTADDQALAATSGACASLPVRRGGAAAGAAVLLAALGLCLQRRRARADRQPAR